MSNTLLENFPSAYKANQSQVTLLNSIEKAFKDGYKFVVCCAPTGSGKSFISKTLSNISVEPSDKFTQLIDSYDAYKIKHTGGYAHADECEEEKAFGTFALTITKTLQDQYKDLFNEISVLKGKSNYQCEVDNKYTTEIAPCLFHKSIKDDCWEKNKCPYYNARNTALKSTFATLNYTMFFALPVHVKRKEYMVCDEASELEDQIVKQFTCSVSFETLRRSDITIPPFEGDNYDKAFKWVNNVLIKVTNKVEALQELLVNKAPVNKPKIKATVGEENKKLELLMLRGLQSKLTALQNNWNECEYLFETDTKSISFIPLKVDKLATNLFDHADKVILMSATIIDHKNYCKALGITNYKYVEVESSFDAKNAPIYVQSKVKLSYNNLKQELPKIAKQIIEICNHHKNDKGVIHTHTNSITSYLHLMMKGSRYLFREPGINNENLLDQHYNTEEPTVLISPSMGYGVDLKDDLARFQIIIKAPYLPMKEKRVERLMKIDKDWYMNKMLGSMIQACGRGIRSSKDHCVTYILDGAIIDSVIKNKNKLPKYFLDRFV